MFSKILTSALFAGFATGILVSVLQFMFVQPVLLHAELYEGGTLQHFGAVAVSSDQDLGGFDLTRDGLSILFTVLIYTGYALILAGAMAMATDRGIAVTPRSGLIWGIAGFIAVHFAPAFGQPPEVPGVAAADVLPRQIWWFLTVIATACALALIAFGNGWAMWGAAIVLLAAPHVIGAPEPDSFSGPVPPELAALFASRALGVGLAAWVMLGGLCAYFWRQELEET